MKKNRDNQKTISVSQFQLRLWFSDLIVPTKAMVLRFSVSGLSDNHIIANYVNLDNLLELSCFFR